ncbi:30S ribosomal protein S17e [Candidatus Pacearchaeota archaeon]|nr:30S ribosomal protein S17e [Candidatus Pacearchaeota archaeon]
MGRIKSSLIKRTAKTLVKENSSLSPNFDENKITLQKYTLPDKGTRNKIAGYIVRLKRAGNVPKPRKNLENIEKNE